MQAKRHKKWWRITLWVLSLFVLLTFGLHLSFIFYFNNQIKNGLVSEFSIQTNGEYTLQIDELRTNVFNQSVFLKNFKVIPVKGSRMDVTKYCVAAKTINLEDFNLFAFLLSRDLKFRSLELADPKFIVFRNNVDHEPDSAIIKKGKFSLYKILKPYVNSFSIQYIQVSNAEIKLYNNDKDSLLLLNSSQNELNISDLRINEESEKSDRLFLAEKTNLTIQNFSFTTQNKLYTIKASKVFASYSGSTVYVDSVQLIPNYSKQEFAHMAGEQTDRLALSVSKVEFRHMDVKLFFEKNWFIARHLKMSNVHLDSYRDKNDRRKPNKPHSIQSLINSIPVNIRIDSIMVKNAECVYEEVALNAVIPGRITFNKADALITGFINRRSGNKNNDDMVLNANCLLMNNARLHVIYRFPFETEGMVFDCSGHLSGMRFTELNKVLEPIAQVSAMEGQIDSMIFSFHAGDISSEGQMKLVYHNLKIEILKNKEGKRKEARHFLSFLARSFIIKEQNPTGSDPIRVTRIHYVRDDERFIFNYSLKSVLSGIKTAIGIPDLKRKNNN